VTDGAQYPWPRIRGWLLTLWLVAGPLIGVFFLHWDAFMLILFFWLENLVLGALGLAKVLMARGGEGGRSERTEVALRFGSHYGLFCLLHGIFICLVLAPEPPPDAFVLFYGFVAAYHAVTGPEVWPLIPVALGHLTEALRDCVASGAYRRISPEQAMALPFARLIVLHFALVLGGLVADLLGSITPVLLVLILMKALIERAPCAVTVDVG